MCGIAGILSLRAGAVDNIRARVVRMCEALQHRGPDDHGVALCASGQIALGNQRLAIRDLSAAGHMPMANFAGTVRITYNGEIYNADDLRHELERDGIAFHSSSDTEVILHGYERWGDAVVSRLRGMFAFAIVDERDGSLEMAPARLLLARDRLGIKPLYYTVSGEAIAFASECRALLRSAIPSREVSPRGLVTYLRLGSVPAPLTIYRDVHALPAGTTLAIELGSPTPVREPMPYWSLPVATGRPGPAGDRHQTDRLRSVLLDSVSRHLVSDVPLGAFLSGGLDSTAIVALTRHALPHATIRTCTVAFEGDRGRDAPLARAAARALETEHVEVMVTADDVGRDLEAMVAALDQPSNDGLNTFLVSRAAREAGLTVALSGIGGDELFGGYPSFRRLKTVVRLATLLTSVPGAAGLVRSAAAAAAPNHAVARLAEWTALGANDPAAQYLGLRGLFAGDALADIVRPDVLSIAGEPSDLAQSVRRAAQPSSSTWDAASRFELTCYLRHQLLRDADVMSMAHSLEVRVPFVDHEVVQAVLALPVDARAGNPPKRLLRALVPNLPIEIRNRTDKQTFTLPLDRWMSGPLRPGLGELVDRAENVCERMLVAGAGRRVLAHFDAGRTHWSRPWAIAALATVTT
jgi:asparagine synthase (glutamine-hydrolysing)